MHYMPSYIASLRFEADQRVGSGYLGINYREQSASAKVSNRSSTIRIIEVGAERQYDHRDYGLTF